ncbi:MAG: carbohydrate kinase family protein [Chloroflexota bacterium]
MAKILVAGLINIETTIKMDGFPIDYQPVRYPFHGVNTTVSGVGFNVAKALTTLGHEVRFASLVGDDYAGQLMRTVLEENGIASDYVLSVLDATPQSAILYDESGQRMINTDLKNIQETTYPLDKLDLADIELAVLANINFSRAMLPIVKAVGIPIASDVHVIRSLDDEYNRDYIAQADILFMSDSGLPVTPEAWVKSLWEHHQTAVIGVGLGEKGALIANYTDRSIRRHPAKQLRPIVSTVGSGDALFSAFVHGYLTEQDLSVAMQKAILFAGYKIGTASGSDGFITAEYLDELYATHYPSS